MPGYPAIILYPAIIPPYSALSRYVRQASKSSMYRLIVKNEPVNKYREV